MKTLIASAAVAAAFAALAQPALADSRDCRFQPRSQWMGLNSAADKAAKLGYRVVGIEIDDGCYEVKAVDGNGHRIELHLDPVSGAVVRKEYDD